MVTIQELAKNRLINNKYVSGIFSKFKNFFNWIGNLSVHAVCLLCPLGLCSEITWGSPLHTENRFILFLMVK